MATTEFDLPNEKKWLLRDNGIAAATAFLDAFEPAEYRNAYNAPLAPPGGIR